MPQKTQRIFLVGGGSGGHIQPSRAIASELVNQDSNIEPIFICSRSVLDKEILEATSFRYIRLFSGKLRRYLHWRIFIDWLLIVIGFFQSLYLLIRYRPAVVFCKGGYVCVPMAFAAYLLRKPIVAHESDTVPGLANRVIARFSRQICTGFPLEGNLKYVFTGNPVRLGFQSIEEQDKLRGFEFTKFDNDLPIILVMGGSQGAQYINELLLEALPVLTDKYQIVHITGSGKAIQYEHPRYLQYPYLKEELKGIYAISSLAIARAGANSLAELAAMHIPSIIIPLSSAANNHQYKNAKFFEEKGGVVMLEQGKTSSMELQQVIDELFDNQEKYANMQNSLDQLASKDAASKIANIILECVKKRE